MEITPTSSKTPASLIFTACPPIAVALSWLLLLTAPDGLDGLGQVMLGTTVAFFGSLASLPARRSGGAHRSLATFAAVGNVLVTLQTATILLATVAYLVFW